MSLRNKKKLINCHIKGLYKTTCYKTKSNCSFSFLIDCRIIVFFFPYQSVCKFEKLIRFHWQAFIVYKNGENLKMLIEIFCRKLIVCNIILAFLDHLTPKVFFAGQPWRPIQNTISFQNLWIRPQDSTKKNKEYNQQHLIHLLSSKS